MNKKEWVVKTMEVSRGEKKTKYVVIGYTTTEGTVKHLSINVKDKDYNMIKELIEK